MNQLKLTTLTWYANIFIKSVQLLVFSLSIKKDRIFIIDSLDQLILKFIYLIVSDMKDNQKGQANASNQAYRKLRQPRIIGRNHSPFDGKHSSLRKLMQMRVLPPLHPQTDVKRAAEVVRHCCPEEFHQYSKDVSTMMLGKSEQLLGETPKFTFQNIVIKHMEKQSQQLATISYEQENNSKRKKSELGITFGKIARKLESHRYTEMEEKHPKEKEKKRRPVADISNLCKVGKYDSIFKPVHVKVDNDASKLSKDHALPPINSKQL